MAIHVVRPDDGEQSGGGPIRCRIIEDGSHTGHRLGLIEAVVPPGPDPPAPPCPPPARASLAAPQ